jgi:hypothetical protein
LKAQHVSSGTPLIIRSSKTVLAASGLYVQKNVEPLINFGIINSITKRYLVGISTEE